KVDLQDSLKESARGATRQRLRRSLVTGQIALALMLLIGAGLMINSFIQVERQELGADPRNLLMFEFRWPLSEGAKAAGKYRGVGLWNISPRPAEMFERVAERLRKIPGVISAAGVNNPPLNSGFPLTTPFLIQGLAA